MQRVTFVLISQLTAEKPRLYEGYKVGFITTLWQKTAI